MNHTGPQRETSKAGVGGDGGVFAVEPFGLQHFPDKVRVAVFAQGGVTDAVVGPFEV